MGASKQVLLDGLSIKRANLDGTNVEEIPIADIAHDPFSIVLDVAAGKMYWTSIANPARVRRANLDGTGVEDLATTADGLGYAHGIALVSGVGSTIPAVSEWGLVTLTLLFLAIGTIVIGRTANSSGSMERSIGTGA